MNKHRHTQHVCEFGDISIILDPSVRKLGSYDIDDDIQRHAVYAWQPDGAQCEGEVKEERINNLREI